MLSSSIPTWRSRDIEIFVKNLDAKKNIKSLSSPIETLIEEDSRSENYLVYLLMCSVRWVDPLKNVTELFLNDKTKVEIISKRLKSSQNIEQLLDIIGYWVVHKIPLNLIVDGFKRFLDFFKLNKEHELLMVMVIGNKFIEVYDRDDQLFEQEENDKEKMYEVLDVNGDLKNLGRESLKFSKAEIIHMIIVRYLLDVSNRLADFKRINKKINIDKNLADLLFLQFEKLFKNFEEEFMEVQTNVEYFLREILPSVSHSLLYTQTFHSLNLNFEDFYEVVEDPQYKTVCEDGLDLITDSLCLHEVLFEIGVEVMNDPDMLEKIVRQFNNIDTLDLLKTFIFFLEQNQMTHDRALNEKKDNITTKILLFDSIEKEKMKEIPKTYKWDIEMLVKTINKIFFTRISWIKIIESLDTDDPLVISMMKNLPLFKLFWELVNNILSWFDLRMSYSLFNKPWKHFKAQKIFLISCFELIKDGFDLCIPEEMDPQKNLNNKILISELNKNFGLKGITIDHVDYVRDLGPLWVDPIVVTSLIEITEDKKCFNKVSSLLEYVLKKNSHGILLVLFNCKPKEGLKLFQEILISSLKMILESNHNFIKLIESFFKTDRDLFSLILAQIAEQGDKLMIISKILDLSQNIKESLLTLTKSKNHIFSIKLALLAVKKEYLRLEFWVNERLNECGVEWVEAFLRFISWNLIMPISQYDKNFKIEKVLEESLLTMNSIAIIFENFLLNKEHENKIGSEYIDIINQTYKKIKELIPKLSQVSINDTDKKANELLEKFYAKEYDINEFIKELQMLKSSDSNRDQEILSCIIINVVDEFRFYKDFPTEELNLTAYLFGGIIKNKIIDGKTCSIIIKAVIDNLKSEEKMFNFAMIILNEIVETADINNNHILAILNNDNIYNNNFELINKLKTRLDKDKNTSMLTQEHLDKIEKKKQEIQEKELERISLQKKNENLENAKLKNKKTIINYILSEEEDNSKKKQIEMVELQKFYSKFSSVDEFLEYKLEELQKTKNVKQDIKDKIFTMMKKLIDPVDNFIIEYNQLVTTPEIEDWFCYHFFFKKCIKEAALQKTCLSFLMKLKKPNLLHQIYLLSMEIVDEIMKYGRFNDITNSKENYRLREMARWLTVITFSRNKPILKYKLDIRKRILEALLTISINAFIPMISIIISSCTSNQYFTINNPYIQSLLDLFKELYRSASVSKESRGFITNLFKTFNLNLEEIRPFNYLGNKSSSYNNESFKKSMMTNKIFLDINKLNPMLMKHEKKIREYVAMAISAGVKKVIKPVKERSIKNAILTTRTLCKQDLTFEPCDHKFLEACKTLAINLTGNLALVTCREPLRTSISSELNRILDENFRDKLQRDLIKNAVIEQNLNVACEMIYKRVISEVIEQINQDPIIMLEVEKRKKMKKTGTFVNDSDHNKMISNLPLEMQVDHKNNNLNKIELYNPQSNKISIKTYTNIYRTDHPLINVNMNTQVNLPTRAINENDLRNLIKDIENEINTSNSENKMSNISNKIYQINHYIKSIRGNIKQVTSNQTIYVLKKIKNFNFDIEKVRPFIDILYFFSKYNRQIAEIMAENVSTIPDDFKYKLDFITTLFKKNLINFKIFDEKSSINLKNEPENFLNGITQILKKLVIDDKIFDIEAFKCITNELQNIKPSNYEKIMKKGSLVFIKNLQNYLRNKSTTNKTNLNLSNLKFEYKKIKKDLEDYFISRKQYETELAEKLHNDWFQCSSDKERQIFVKDFINKILKNISKSEKKCNTILILSYWMEKLYENSIKNGFIPDYTQIDSICCLVIMTLEQYTNQIGFIENFMSSIIIIITKYHFLNKNNQVFNQKPMFRILYNIFIEIHKRKDIFKDSMKKIISIIMHTLRIVQPVQCPAFSFAWLALLSNRYFIKTVLKTKNPDLWNQYSHLICGLMMFFKELRGINKSMSIQLQRLYKATLYFLLVLAHDFPNFVYDQADMLLEEVPKDFKQFRNIILSASPLEIKMVGPDKAANNLAKIEKEAFFYQTLSNKIDNRINSMNILVLMQNYLTTTNSNEIEKIRDTMYLFDYSGERFVNEKIVKAFTFYCVYLLFHKNTKSVKKKLQNGSTMNTKVIQNEQKFHKQKIVYSKIFLLLLMKNDFSLRECLINSIVDNLRTLDLLTIYFIQLLQYILKESKNLEIEELIYKVIFERFLIGDIKPWGLTTATFYLTKVFGNELFNKKYYMENKNLFNRILNIINIIRKKKYETE